MDLENILLSERQIQETCIIPVQEMQRKGKSMEVKSRMVIAWSWGREWRLTVNGHGEFY